MRLSHCMDHDWPWIAATIGLDLAVAAGYIAIARHWWTNQRRLADGPARRALGDMRTIFLFCGLCGYLFVPIKMFWPAWRLYDAFLFVLVVVTWRYALSARNLRVIYDSLDRSDRLALELDRTRDESRTKSFFIGALGHDLRTPLAGMMLSLDEAELGIEMEDPRAARRALGELRKCLESSARLVEGAIDLGRLELAESPVRRERVGLHRLLNEVADEVRPLAHAKGLDLRVACHPELQTLSDEDALRRLVVNLAHNAVKFTDRGGVRISARPSGAEVAVEVDDEGVGIPADRIPRIFEPLYQIGNSGRDPAGGHGMGLAIVRRLADRLRAPIEVESEVDRGSRFIVRLPRGAPDDGPRAGPVGPGARADR